MYGVGGDKSNVPTYFTRIKYYSEVDCIIKAPKYNSKKKKKQYQKKKPEST